LGEGLVSFSGGDEEGEDGFVFEGDFGADEGAGAVVEFFGGVVGAGGAVEAVAVGEGEGGEAEGGGLADEFFGLGGAAVEGEGGAGVEFGEHFF
jgi:hypothetical protein